MEEGKEQIVDKREQSLRVFRSIFDRVESMDITTAAVWIGGLYVMYLMRDLTSLGFTSFQNICIIHLWLVMLMLMFVTMHQARIYHRLGEIGGVKR